MRQRLRKFPQQRGKGRAQFAGRRGDADARCLHRRNLVFRAALATYTLTTAPRPLAAAIGVIASNVPPDMLDADSSVEQ